MRSYKITGKQYEVIAQKREQLQTYFNSGYATGLDQAWKVEAGKIYALLTGRIYNTACSDCIGGFLRPLYDAMQRYEREQAENNFPPPKEITKDAETVIDPEKKNVIINDPPKNNKGNNKRNERPKSARV